MNRIILILFFIVSSICVGFSQKTSLQKLLDNDLKIAQKEGTDFLLKQYLSSVNSRSDILYAVIFRPMSCPRCEATIPFLNRTLKKMYPDSEILLISAYEDENAARQYISRNNYIADYYLFDTNREYDKIFSFNSNGLYGLYILKLDKKNGRMILGGSPYTQDDQLIQEIYDKNEALPYHTFENKKEETESMSTAFANVSLTYEMYCVNEGENYPVSGVYEFPVMRNGLFAYSDELANAGYCFAINPEKKTIDFKNIIVADSLEKDRYVDIPQNEYEIRKQYGIIYYIACGINLIGDERIALSYSLPKLFMESPTNMAYYNQPAIIVKNTESLKSEPMIELDFDLFNESFMYTHFTFFAVDSSRIVFGCKKNTWPIEFEPEEYKGNVDRDPFMDGFYETDCPYLAVFDTKTGKVMKRFGQLDLCQRLSRTGYFYTNPLISCEGESMVYGNGYVGKLFLASKDSPEKVEKELSVFDVDMQNFPPLDSLSFYKPEHVKAYNPFFSKCIESVILSGNRVHCLVRAGSPLERNILNDAYEYVSIDRKSGTVIDRFKLDIDNGDKNDRLLCFGLGKDGTEVTPYYFAKKGNKPYVKFIYKVE